MYVLIHVQVFFYEDILDPKWIFVIHYDPRLRHVFDDALVDTEQNNDGQQNEREGLENIEENDIHDDVEDGYVQAQEDNNPKLDDVMEDNNMDGIENDDPKNEREGLENIEENDIHDDVEDSYVQAQENNNPKLDDVMEDNNMDGIENDDPNPYGNNMDALQSNFNDDEDDAIQDEDDDKIKYLKEHMNIDNDTLENIVADNNVNGQDF